jgi:RNA polymerase primary sigma factor
MDDVMMGDIYSSDLSERDFLNMLESIIDTLTEKEQNVIRFRYVSALSFNEIAEIYGVSGGRMQQVNKKALRKLRHPSRLGRLIKRQLPPAEPAVDKRILHVQNMYGGNV